MTHAPTDAPKAKCPINFFKVGGIMKSLEWPSHFSNCKSMGDFSTRPRAGNSTVHDPIWPNFELGREFMVTFVTCKTEEDPIKNKGARVATRFSPLTIDEGLHIYIACTTFCRINQVITNCWQFRCERNLNGNQFLHKICGVIIIFVNNLSFPLYCITNIRALS